jgi:predicted ATPase
MSNSGVKIEKVSIKNFRRFHNIKFNIGKCVTLIAGQNGTSKSTLLGMLCQPFSFGVIQGIKAGSKDNSKYTDNYHNRNLADYKDLTGNYFIYDCEDVFRLSNIHDVDPNKYRYTLYLEGDCITEDSPVYAKGLWVRAQSRTGKRRIRFVAGPPGKISSEAGEGNFPHPVIYFGLNRHWPLALTKSLSISNHPEISNEDKEWYIEKYNQILYLSEDKNIAEFVKADKKNFVGTASEDYNSESFSAGQDNLSQFLTALLSFKYLKKKLGNKYKGGLILIDELDSTLHADAQMALLETLCNEADNLDLQIIATTHSLFMLHQAFNSRLKNKIKVIYLQRKDSLVVESGYATYKAIENDLKIEAEPIIKKRTGKVSLIFEDNVGNNMFWGIMGKGLNRYCSRFVMESLSAGTLKNLAAFASKVPEFGEIILIPDGDVREEFEPSRNLVFLPGKERPETLLYKCLKNISESDDFWTKSSSGGYNKKVAFKNYRIIPNNAKEAKDFYKGWYKEQSKHWKPSDKIVYEKWADSNKELCKQFCKEFFKILKRINPSVPRKIIQKIEEKYRLTK